MSVNKRRGYVLIEVLLAMTILSITGGALIRSLQNSVEASRKMRDLTKAIYLTQGKLHELKLNYFRRFEPPLGEFRGEYEAPGTEKYYWVAVVERDRQMDAFIITVWTHWSAHVNHNARGRYQDFQDSSYMLRTMVPTARFNENLIFGNQPQQRFQRERERGRNRGQERGSRMPGGRGQRGGR